MAEELRPLPGPYEILDLSDGQGIEFAIDRWEQGTIVIHPKYAGAPTEQTIIALRLHLPIGYKPVGLPYWDITSKTLRAQLLPLLMYRNFNRFLYAITKHGVRPRARFSLSRRPL